MIRTCIIIQTFKHLQVGYNSIKGLQKTAMYIFLSVYIARHVYATISIMPLVFTPVDDAWLDVWAFVNSISLDKHIISIGHIL